MRGVLSFLLTVGLSLAPNASGSDPAAFEAGLHAFLHEPVARGAKIAVLVAELRSGNRLLSHHADRLLVPASNQKLLLAAAALEHWGPAHRFETLVFVDGPVAKDGALKGALWVVGRGDPSLVSERLWKLAETIRLQGITQIRGGLAIDRSYLDAMRLHPDWGPPSARAYHAPTSAFAANYSAFRIELLAAQVSGEPIRVRVAPDIPYFRVRSDAITIASGGRLQLELERLPDGSGERVRVRGAAALNGGEKTYWRAVSLPEFYAASLLRAQLESQGIEVLGPVRLGELPESAHELVRFAGEPVGGIVSKLNKFSNNFIAEQLIKMLGAEVFGPPGTWEKGTAAIREYLNRIGLQTAGAIVADGSGLSPRNRVSAAMLVSIIRNASLRFGSGPEFVASLPLGGLDGTLEDRMNGEPFPIRGKTGHLRHVASFSGVLPSATQGEWLVFSILVNGARGRPEAIDEAIDRFVSRIADVGGNEVQGTTVD